MLTAVSNPTVTHRTLLPSLSSSATTAGLPADTLAGSVPNPIDRLSPASSVVSSTAITVNVLRVSFAPNVTLAGTPE